MNIFFVSSTAGRVWLGYVGAFGRRTIRHPDDHVPSSFVSDESGVTTVSMVVLMATIVSISISVTNVVGRSAVSLADSTAVAIKEVGGDNLEDDAPKKSKKTRITSSAKTPLTLDSNALANC